MSVVPTLRRAIRRTARSSRLPLVCITFAAITACGDSEPVEEGAARPGTHEELVAFWGEWREFERPSFDGGVPDYGTSAMSRQFGELQEWMA